jgi:hypothetical protein
MSLPLPPRELCFVYRLPIFATMTDMDFSHKLSNYYFVSNLLLANSPIALAAFGMHSCKLPHAKADDYGHEFRDEKVGFMTDSDNPQCF